MGCVLSSPNARVERNERMPIYWAIPMVAFAFGGVVGAIGMAVLCAAGRADDWMNRHGD